MIQNSKKIQWNFFWLYNNWIIEENGVGMIEVLGGLLVLLSCLARKINNKESPCWSCICQTSTSPLISLLRFFVILFVHYYPTKIRFQKQYLVCSSVILKISKIQARCFCRANDALQDLVKSPRRLLLRVQKIDKFHFWFWRFESGDRAYLTDPCWSWDPRQTKR